MNKMNMAKKKLEIISGVHKRMTGHYVAMEQHMPYMEFQETTAFIEKNNQDLYSQNIEFDLLGNEGS